MFSNLPVIILDVTKTNFMLKMHFKVNQSYKSRIFTSISKISSLAIRSCGLHYCVVLPKHDSLCPKYRTTIKISKEQLEGIEAERTKGEIKIKVREPYGKHNLTYT
jgi:hypothetical protein